MADAGRKSTGQTVLTAQHGQAFRRQHLKDIASRFAPQEPIGRPQANHPPSGSDVLSAHARRHQYQFPHRVLGRSSQRRLLGKVANDSQDVPIHYQLAHLLHSQSRIAAVVQGNQLYPIAAHTASLVPLANGQLDSIEHLVAPGSQSPFKGRDQANLDERNSAARAWKPATGQQQRRRQHRGKYMPPTVRSQARAAHKFSADDDGRY